jgi:hypothetical protein
MILIRSLLFPLIKKFWIEGSSIKEGAFLTKSIELYDANQDENKIIELITSSRLQKGNFQALND